MSRAYHREVSTTDKRTNRRLAFGVFAAPVAWFLHEIIGVAVTGRHCEASMIADWQWTVYVILPIVAAAIALAGLVTAYGVFRHNFQGKKITRVEGWGRVEFVAVFGVFLSSFLLLNIIYFGVMPFVVDPCVRSI